MTGSGPGSGPDNREAGDLDPGYALALTVCRLALEPTSGRIRHTGRVGIAVRGALFAELALAGRLIGIRAPRALDASDVTGEPADSLHKAVVAHRIKPYKRWFSHTTVDVEAALRALARHQLITPAEHGGWRDIDPGLVAEQSVQASQLVAMTPTQGLGRTFFGRARLAGPASARPDRPSVPTEDAVVALLATGAGLGGGRPRPRAALASLNGLLPPSDDVRIATARAAVHFSLRAVRGQAGLRFLSG